MNNLLLYGIKYSYQMQMIFKQINLTYKYYHSKSVENNEKYRCTTDFLVNDGPIPRLTLIELQVYSISVG